MSDKFQDKYRIPSARAEWWDYRNDAAYFITICTAGRDHYFGEIQDETMNLSEIGTIAHQNWIEIPNHFPFIKLDAFVIMPNHIHGIVVIENPIGYDDNDNDDIIQTLHVDVLPVETLHATSLPENHQPTIKNEKMATISPKKGSLSSVIRSYKSAVSKDAHPIHADFDWQTRFHDHIIRDEESYQKIREYILDNPKRWDDDKYNNAER
jgi:putative transposase